MWIPTDNKYGFAIHNWHGNVRFGLPLDVGDFVEILEESGPWFRGTCPRKPRMVGLFPKSYIHIKDLTKTDPVVSECTQVLREWAEIWKKLFVDREVYKFFRLRKVMLSLLESRRELLSATLTQDQTIELQLKVVSKIDWGNRKLCLDLVPRVGPLTVDPYKVGIVSLHNVHVTSAENSNVNRGTMRRKASKKILTHHLYFCMRDFSHRIGDDAEILFYLYDGLHNRALSERFLVKMPREGFSNYIETLHNNCTIFSDLGASELSADLYLVANIMRVGKIIHSESVKKNDKGMTNQVFRRPCGVAVLSLSDIAQFDNSIESEEKEYNFKVYQCEEKDYHQLHQLLIKQASKYSLLTSVGQCYGIVISLKLLHGNLDQAREEQPMLFQGTTVTKKIGFPDVIMPGDVRNDLFITLDRGEFERGGKSTPKNIEVTVMLKDSAGRVIPDCLCGASGIDSSSSYKSMLLYHNNQPSWNETLRLAVPIEGFPTAHVLFGFSHCSTRDRTEPKLFGFSFIRLMEQSGATLPDGTHDLYVYKCDDLGKLATANYLRLQSSSNDLQGHTESGSMYHRSPKELFSIKSLLCSTKLTQNGDLLSLLQWRASPDRIQDALQRVLRLKDEELIKFLQDVLDALFAMFSTEDGNSTTHSGSVFHVLVSIFSLLQSSKFQLFKPVLNAYIENHFSATLVYKGLLSSVQHCAEWMTTSERPEPIQKCFSSLEYIFKFIIQSRKLCSQATGGQFEDSFRRDLYVVFTALNNMLSVQSYDAILPTQEALLHSVGVVLEQLQSTLPPAEIGNLAKNLLDAVPREANPILVQAKLQAIKDIVSGKLFQDDELRSILLGIACKHLRVHLSRRDELKLCAEILGEILIHLHDLKEKQKDELSNILQHDLDTLCCNILDILLQTIMIVMEGSTAVLSSLVAVLLGLLQQLDESHYSHLMNEMSANGETKELKEFLHRESLVFKELLTTDWQVFPNDWLVLKMTANNIMRKSLEEFAKPLVFRFLGTNSFDSHLWWSYFSVAVMFLTQPSLQLEQYHEAKRRKILSTHGDMRVQMGFQILSMWSQLGEHKLNFIPSMVGPFLEVTLVPEPALRKATLTVFYDMMQCEQSARGSFRLVESELIDKLDLLISENKGDDEYRELFSTILLERVEADQPPWRESGIAFISSVTKLLERLLDYRSVMQGEENRDKRMTCIFNLLNFYKTEINRKEMYLRYVYKLHDLQLSAENFVEAGFTLKLYADMLSWNKEILTFAPNETAGEPEWQRKEKLYHTIIQYFDKGKCWEKGVPLCKELAQLYETKRFDYIRLSDILTTQAKFFQNIIQIQIRPEPEYFRVGFYGTSYPLFVRNKQFIYRGLPYEPIGEFTQRLQTEFPQAQILTRKPDDNIMYGSEQYIHISNVRPIADPVHLKSATVPITERIARFYEVNDITKFQHDRPVHKGVIDKDNEFKSLWIERTIFDIAKPLPGILRWFEVVHKTSQELTPVEYACETMNNCGKIIEKLIAQYKSDPKRDLNPLTMRLQGTIDANVMGGISKYQDAFFSEAYASSAEGKGQAANVLRLKSLIIEQMQIVQTALELHGQLASSSVKPLHSRLEERFSQLNKSLAGLGKLRRQQSDSIVNTPLPPLPFEKRATSLNNPSTSTLSNTIVNGHSGRSSNAPVYEQDDIYTRPVESSNFDYSGIGQGNRESLVLPEIINISDTLPAPPIPTRPKSSGYLNNSATDSPEVPPKRQVSAPPLPPRGFTPDKRASNSFSDYSDPNHNAPNVPRRSHKYSVVDISLEESDNISQHQQRSSNDQLSFFSEGRGSGISTSSQELNNLNSNGEFSCQQTSVQVTLRGHQKTNSNPEVLNIHGNDSPNSYIPPPIPPKVNSLHDTSHDYILDDQNNTTTTPPDEMNTELSFDSSDDGYRVPNTNREIILTGCDKNTASDSVC